MAMMAVGLGGAGGMLGGGGLLKMGIMGASMLGSFMGGGKKEENSTKLNDLKVSSSAYGQGIPLVYGTMRVTGNMFWATDFDEEKKYYKKGGKKEVSKGKKEKKAEEVYEYYANFAMGLAAGQVKEVLRIWADSNLIYDKYGRDKEEVVSPGFSTEQNGGTSQKGGKQGKGKGGSGGDSGRFRFRFYSGSETQLPDRFMKREPGEEYVPGHRGLCYLFFEHFALQDFGNRTPTITAEISAETRRNVTGNLFQPIEYINLTEDPDIPGPADTYPDMSVGTTWKVDPVNKLFYVWNASLETIRIYDMNTFKEVGRCHIPSIPTVYTPWVQVLGGPFPPPAELIGGPDLTDFLGPSAMGDLVFRGPGGPNSYSVVFVDVNSFIPKARWGEGGSGTGVDQDSMFLPDDAFLQNAPDATTGMDNPITIVSNIRGDFAYFDAYYQMIGYVNNPFGYIGNTYEHIFVPATDPKSSAYYQTRTSVDDYEVRLKTGAYASPYTLDAEGNLDVVYSDENAYELLYARATNPLLGESIFYAVKTMYMVGAECVGIIEVVGSDNDQYSGTFAVKLDEESGELLWREKVSGDTSTMIDCYVLPIQTGNKFVFHDDGIIYEIDFAQESINNYPLPAEAPPILANDQLYYAFRGALMMKLEGTDYNDLGVIYVDRKAQYPASLVGIVLDICTRIGLDVNTQVDVTELTDTEIDGYIVEQPASARSIIEELADLFFFDVYESDYMLKFKSRDRTLPFTADETIVQDQLGIVEEVGGGYEVLKEVRNQEIDLPQTVNLTFIDPKNEYNTNNQHVRRPNSPMQTMHTKEKLDINVAMSLGKNKAKSMAHRILYGLWSERVTYEFKMSWEFIALDPTDVLQITMDSGYVVTARLTQADFGVNYEIDAQGISHLNGVYSAEKTGAEAGNIVVRQKVFPPALRALVHDIPYIREADADVITQPEIYVGVGALRHAFRFANMKYSVGVDSDDLKDVASFGYDVPWGSVAGDIPAPADFHLTDTETQIVLTPQFNFALNDGMYEWASIDPAVWPNDDENIIVIGKEIIKFRDVVENADGTVTISHLIRGCRGTEEECYLHSGVETWVILTEIGTKDDIQSRANIGQIVNYEVFGASVLDITFSASLVPLEGRSLYPWGPCAFQRSEAAGDTTITWDRRARVGGLLIDGTGTIPVAEESEEYQLFILDAPYDPATSTFDPGDPLTYVRVFEDLVARTATYTAAMKVTDGVGEFDPIYVVGYQISSYVGRGFPGWATINHYAV
jgi:hypothetical protein